MPVKPRGNSWQASVTHKGRRFRRDFPTQPEALQWEAEAKAALLRGELPPMGNWQSGSASNMTMQELFNYTMKHRWNDKSHSIITNGRTAMRAIGPDVLVRNVTTQSVDNCISLWLTEGNTTATVNRKLSALSTLLTEAVRLGVIASKPYVRWQEESEHRLRWFTEEEEEKIVAYFRHIGKHELADLVIVAVDTGLRQGTLLKLLPSYIEINPDGQTSWARIPGTVMKAKSPHDLPLTPRARDILAARAKGKAPRDRLFDLTKDQVRHFWDTMKAGIGMADDRQFVFHVLRHTFGSRLVQRGVPIEVVQKLMAHKTLQQTMKYAKLAPKNLTDAIGVLANPAEVI